MNKIAKIDPKEFGIDTKTYQGLTDGLNVVRKERALLDEQFEVVSKLELVPENIGQFRKLRIAYRDNRTKGVDPWHKTQKDIPLRMGQLLDAIKNSEHQIIKSKEDVLEKAEKHFELLEIERLKKVQEERVAELLPYDPDANTRDLSSMEDDLWDAFLAMKIKMHEDAIKEEERKEAERQAELKAKEEENERIRLENEALRKKAEAEKAIRDTRSKELRPYIVFIRDYSALIESDEKSYKKQLAEIKSEAELQWQKDLEESEKRAKKIKDRERQAFKFAKDNGYQLGEDGLTFRDHFIGSRHFNDLQSDEDLISFKKGITAYIEKFRRQDEMSARADLAINFLIELEFTDLNDKWSDGSTTIFTTEFDRFESDTELDNFKASVLERIKLAKAQQELDKRKAEEARIASENLAKGDGQKMTDLLADLNALKTKYKFESPEFVKRYEIVGQLIDKIVVWAKK